MKNFLASTLFIGGFSLLTHGIAQSISYNLYYIMFGLLAIFVSAAIATDGNNVKKGR